MEANGDISKKTVAILLVVAVVLAVVGTWVILSSGPVVVKAPQKSTTGEVRLTILSSPVQSTEGKVQLTIVPNEQR